VIRLAGAIKHDNDSEELDFKLIDNELVRGGARVLVLIEIVYGGR
jgi:hypothetical protein